MSRDDARGRLENALTDIKGVVSVLEAIDEGKGEIPREAISYLAGQLEEHLAMASDAFAEIFGLDGYSKDGAAGGRPVEAIIRD